jgi:hypothetical protein
VDLVEVAVSKKLMPEARAFSISRRLSSSPRLHE